MSKTVFLTGASGFLGAHLVPELLKNQYSLFCLVRSQRDMTAHERLKKMLTSVYHSEDALHEALSHITVLDGDLSEENFGISSSEYSNLRESVDTVLHCAAMTTFSPNLAKEQWRVNVSGTENLMRFALDGKPLGGFHHISTAYVAGDRHDTVYETELDKGQGFYNEYERSKFHAEKLLLEHRKNTDMPVTIYRPSIIVGDSTTGRTVLFNGIYLFVRLLHLAKQSFEGDKNADGKVVVPLRCLASSTTTKNFVHIDYVVKMIMTIFSQKETHGKTYHLTHDDPPTLDLMREVVHDTLGIAGTEFVDEHSFEKVPPNDFESMLLEQTSMYSSYLIKEPMFDKSTLTSVIPPAEIPPCPPMDRRALEKLFQFALESNWGRKRPT